MVRALSSLVLALALSASDAFLARTMGPSRASVVSEAYNKVREPCLEPLRMKRRRTTTKTHANSASSAHHRIKLLYSSA